MKFRIREETTIDCFEPIFGFLMQFCFKKHRSDPWNPNWMISALSGRSAAQYATWDRRLVLN